MVICRILQLHLNRVENPLNLDERQQINIIIIVYLDVTTYNNLHLY
jgi:hypothetical protein